MKEDGLMKRKTILKKFRQAAAERLICNIWRDGAEEYTNAWPLLVSDELVVCALDVDFQFNGYVVYAIDHIRHVTIKEDKCAEFSRREGMLEQLTVPEVAWDDWPTLLASLPEGNLIGVERWPASDDEASYIVGRIVRVGRKRLRILYLTPDACWKEAPWRVRYRDINELVFGDRYLTVFAKYADEPLQLEK